MSHGSYGSESIVHHYEAFDGSNISGTSAASLVIGCVASIARAVSVERKKAPPQSMNKQFHCHSVGVSPRTALYSKGATAAPMLPNMLGHPITEAVYLPPTSCA